MNRALRENAISDGIARVSVMFDKQALPVTVRRCAHGFKEQEAITG